MYTDVFRYALGGPRRRETKLRERENDKVNDGMVGNDLKLTYGVGA